jgi:hypothetical protein
MMKHTRILALTLTAAGKENPPPSAPRAGRLVLVLSSLIVALLTPFVRAQAAEAPALTAWTPCDWGSADCNVCVADAVGAIESLRAHGDAMGFHMNGASDPTLLNHWEGVQRLMGSGGRYLAVSRAIGDEADDISFVIVEMASRNDQGLRFRSNRLDPQRHIVRTPPPTNDRIVATVPHEAGFTHAGGIQALGDVLAVPFESDSQSKVVFYDVADPLRPIRLENSLDHTPLSTEAGTATLGKLADGRFLLVVGRKAANVLDFYVSTGTDLTSTSFEFFDTWSEGELTGDDGEFGDYQALSFVAQCDGTAFLVGTHKSLAGDIGRDFVDLFRVENGSGSDVAIAKVAKKHLYCERTCDLDAAGGAYVDPEGRLYLYGTTHDNDGPIAEWPMACVGPACSVELAEFRPVPHATCGRIEDAWAELYDDADDDIERDRSLMVDFVDRDQEDYLNFDHAEGFEDKPSAVRWCLPDGATFRLWQDKNPCGGSMLDLVGDGTFHQISNLDSVNFGDTASCAHWLGGPVARPGEDRIAECTGPTTPVRLDGRESISIEGDTLSFFWQAPGITFDDSASPTPIGGFPLDETPVTLTVADSAGSDSEEVVVKVVDTIAPTIHCPADLVVNAIAPTGAPVVYPAPSAADSCSVSSVVCGPASGDIFAVGTTTVQCAVTDGAGHADACSFTVEVKSPAEQVADLIDQVKALSNVAVGTRNSLLTKLEDALNALINGRTMSACGKLKDFLGEVSAMSGKKLTEAQAGELIADGTRIREAAGCP